MRAAIRAGVLSLVLGCGVVVFGIGIMLIVGFVAYSAGLHADSASFESFIRRHLPAGATEAQTASFLYSPPMLRFEEQHGFDAVTDDMLTPRVGARYQPDDPGYQIYPGGSSILVERDSDPYGTTLTLQFFYDQRGHLTSFTAGENWAGI